MPFIHRFVGRPDVPRAREVGIALAVQAVLPNLPRSPPLRQAKLGRGGQRCKDTILKPLSGILWVENPSGRA